MPTIFESPLFWLGVSVLALLLLILVWKHFRRMRGDKLYFRRVYVPKRIKGWNSRKDFFSNQAPGIPVEPGAYSVEVQMAIWREGKEIDFILLNSSVTDPVWVLRQDVWGM